MTETAPVSHALIEFRSDRLGEFVVAMQGTGFQLRPLAESSLPARPIKADYEITDVEVGP